MALAAKCSSSFCSRMRTCYSSGKTCIHRAPVRCVAICRLFANSTSWPPQPAGDGRFSWSPLFLFRSISRSSVKYSQRTGVRYARAGSTTLLVGRSLSRSAFLQAAGCQQWGHCNSGQVCNCSSAHCQDRQHDRRLCHQGVCCTGRSRSWPSAAACRALR